MLNAVSFTLISGLFHLKERLFVCAAHNTLQKQCALPVRPVIPLVARISDQNASGAPPMAVRDKSRLDKFKLLLASPSTDLGELASVSTESSPVLGRVPVAGSSVRQVPQVLSHTHLSHVPDADLQERRSDVTGVEAASEFSC